jgi:hypothetical protein
MQKRIELELMLEIVLCLRMQVWNGGQITQNPKAQQRPQGHEEPRVHPIQERLIEKKCQAGHTHVFNDSVIITHALCMMRDFMKEKYQYTIYSFL